jgi:hypothetical protein
MRQGFTIPGGLADVRFRIFVNTYGQCRAPTGVPHVNENRYNRVYSRVES